MSLRRNGYTPSLPFLNFFSWTTWGERHSSKQGHLVTLFQHFKFHQYHSCGWNFSSRYWSFKSYFRDFASTHGDIELCLRSRAAHCLSFSLGPRIYLCQTFCLNSEISGSCCVISDTTSSVWQKCNECTSKRDDLSLSVHVHAIVLELWFLYGFRARAEDYPSRADGLSRLTVTQYWILKIREYNFPLSTNSQRYNEYASQQFSILSAAALLLSDSSSRRAWLSAGLEVFLKK
jgi:hypothetical protein